MTAAAPYRRKLIETAIPLDAINRESAREKSIRHGHPSTLHLWWSRKPLAACRAVIFCSLIDDPGEEGVPAELLAQIDALPAPNPLPADWGALDAAEQRRRRLFRFIETLVKWESTTDERVIETARELILAATEGNPPPLLDPFCGGGSIPLEAQRLGLEAYASDLNPVAVLITRALIELPPKFAGLPPVNPDARAELGANADWQGAAGLAADVRWYGEWMRQQAWKRIGHLYPKGPNGETVIAWLWARTVACPNPACGAEMPLLQSAWLSKKKGREAWLEPVVDSNNRTRFEVKHGGKPILDGTVNRSSAACTACGASTTLKDIRAQAQRSGLGEQLMAVVEEGDRRRVYRNAQQQDAEAAVTPFPNTNGIDIDIVGSSQRTRTYGLDLFSDLFTPRQLTALTTFSDLVGKARVLVRTHAAETDIAAVNREQYADAVATYLAFAVDRSADRWCALASWQNSADFVRAVFARQVLPMIWDFAEANPFSNSTSNWRDAAEWVAKCLETLPQRAPAGRAEQLDSAAALPAVMSPALSSDPPYYDNIIYADIADFFYVWLRRSLRGIYPDEFSTLTTPKAHEIVAAPYRFDGDRRRAERHFEERLSDSFDLMRGRTTSSTPMTTFYAYKQAERREGESGAVSTGWETMLAGLIDSRLSITATWPMRTERRGRFNALGTNALASSVVIASRPRPADAPTASLPQFLGALRRELPEALQRFIGEHIAPVDLPQASIGPGMAVFSRYAAVVLPNGEQMSVRRALELINEGVEAFFSEREGTFDADTQFCIRWFEQYGFADGPYGDAESLSKAKNVGIAELQRDGLLQAQRGSVQLVPFERYLANWERWDPASDARLNAWESCHYLAAALEQAGIDGAGRVALGLGGGAGPAIELAYRLFAVCDAQSRSREAQRYNALADSWQEISAAASKLREGEQAILR